MPFVWGRTAGDVEFYGRLGFFKVFSCSFKSSPSSFDNFSSAVNFCFFISPFNKHYMGFYAVSFSALYLESGATHSLSKVGVGV